MHFFRPGSTGQCVEIEIYIENVTKCWFTVKHDTTNMEVCSAMARIVIPNERIYIYNVQHRNIHLYFRKHKVRNE